MPTKNKNNRTEKEELKKNIQRARKQNEILAKKGRTLQLQGNEIVKQAENQSEMYDWIKKNIVEEWNELHKDAGYTIYLRNIKRSVKGSVNWTNKTNNQLSEVEPKIDLAVSGTYVSTLSTQINSLTAHANYRYAENPKNAFTMPSLKIDRSNVNKELDKRLMELDTSGELVKLRKAAWQNFYSALLNNLHTACDQMRHILTNLTDDFAKNEFVKEVEWWKYVEGPRDGVSKRQKIRYLICGKKDADIEESEIEEIDDEIDQCKKIHDELCAIAHMKPGYKEAVRDYLRGMEDLLLTILEHRHRIQKIREFNKQ